MINWIIGIGGLVAVVGSFAILARCFDPHDPFGKH